MSPVTAVLKDLYLFAFVYHFGFSNPEDTTEAATPKEIEAPFSPLLLTDSLDTREASVEEYETQTDVGYVFFQGALLHALPTRTFDGVLKRLTYGTSFRIVNTQGKWLQVEHKGTTGWIHEDDMTRSRRKITPRFIYEEYYGADHDTTILLRTFIDDQFHTASLSLPLQDVEYVTYKLSEKGQSLAWPCVRPRIAGTWQRILKGIPGIHLGIYPKKGAVVEYIHANNTGHVAFVESVYPDESITISEIGFPEEGVFHERTLSKEEWIELRPIFIDVA